MGFLNLVVSSHTTGGCRLVIRHKRAGGPSLVACAIRVTHPSPILFVEESAVENSIEKKS